MEQDIEKILALVSRAVADVKGQDKPADYIPALAEVDCSKFGMAISTVDGNDFVVGDAEERFSIQSISKVFRKCFVLVWQSIMQVRACLSGWGLNHQERCLTRCRSWNMNMVLLVIPPCSDAQLAMLITVVRMHD